MTSDPIFVFLQFAYDTTNLAECIADDNGVSKSQVNISLVEASGVRLGYEYQDVCRDTLPACHFPQVSWQKLSGCSKDRGSGEGSVGSFRGTARSDVCEGTLPAYCFP